MVVERETRTNTEAEIPNRKLQPTPERTAKRLRHVERHDHRYENQTGFNQSYRRFAKSYRAKTMTIIAYATFGKFSLFSSYYFVHGTRAIPVYGGKVTVKLCTDFY